MNKYASHKKNLTGLLIICSIILIAGGLAVYFFGLVSLFEVPDTGRNRIPFAVTMLAAIVGLCYSIINLRWLSRKRR